MLFRAGSTGTAHRGFPVKLSNAGCACAFLTAPLLQGWSAHFTAGLGAKLASGAIVSAGAEYGGFGSDVQIWTFKTRANVPF